MRTQIFIRIIFMAIFLAPFALENKSATFTVRGGHTIHHEASDGTYVSAARHLADFLSNTWPMVEKGHYFQFLVEEEVHIYQFNFDRLRRRRRFCNLMCFAARLTLLFIHVSILLFHVDHILNHGFHYLLKSAWT